MILKIFAKKTEDPPKTYTYADYVKTQLDNVTSDYKLGMMTKAEYKDLCKTLNDSALQVAEKKIEELEKLCG